MSKTNLSIGTIDCSGPEGNIYVIVSLAKRIMSNNGFENLVGDMVKRVFEFKSYEEAKSIVAEYVEVEYIN